MTRRKILIVDDSEANRDLLKKILCGDYDVLEAESAGEALACLESLRESVSAVLIDVSIPYTDGYEVLKGMRSRPELSKITVMAAAESGDAEVTALALGADELITKPYNPKLIRYRLRNAMELRDAAAFKDAAGRDRLTGLSTREVFFEKASELIAAHEAGYYVLSCLDVDNFKAINDRYGSAEGDRALRHIGVVFERGFGEAGGLCCRVTGDQFAALYPSSLLNTRELEELCREAALLEDESLHMTISVGRYLVADTSLPISAMFDRASLAQRTVKGRFDVHIAQYDESMREDILRVQDITSEMKSALEDGQFEVWYQPQYNHATGALIGAEALARWRRPGRGLVTPDEFIPVFEGNGFVYELDKFVWEQVCLFLRRWLDESGAPLPVSVNISRCDVYRDDLTEVITGLVEKYSIPVELLRLEITESAFAKSMDCIVSVVRRLTDYGFTMEIDDFGTGYSSLNTLKDVPANVLKLDMRFLESEADPARGGNILESVVRMAKWLGMSVIAEGVELLEQADYLRSIGCNYIQGYLYSRPLPAERYEQLARSVRKEERLLALSAVETLDANAFWDPRAMDALIFNSYTGGAFIFEYHDGRFELLRVNEKYARELIQNGMTVKDALTFDLEAHMDVSDRARLHEAIRRAVESGTEAVCEVRLFESGGARCYLRLSFRALARAGDRLLLYGSVSGLTAQREAERKEREASERLRAIMAEK